MREKLCAAHCVVVSGTLKQQAYKEDARTLYVALALSASDQLSGARIDVRLQPLCEDALAAQLRTCDQPIGAL